MTRLILLFICLAMAAPQAALAQANPYAAAIVINGSAVTNFEIEQRALLLEAVGTPGELEEQAIEQLIDERLRQQAAISMGIVAEEDLVIEGMEIFAQQGGVDTEQFAVMLAEQGVYQETFRDFIRSNIIWQRVLQQRFLSKSLITEAELDAAMDLSTTAISESVLLSEIILPLSGGFENQSRALAVDLARSIKSKTEFGDAATIYSASPSAQNRGQLEWLPLANLPPAISAQVLALSPGQVTRPITMPGALAIFMLHGLRTTTAGGNRPVSVDYVQLVLDGGRTPETLARAEKLIASIDTCEDLQAKSDDFPPDRYSRDIQRVGTIPSHIALELAKLDKFETSTALTRGENKEFLVVLMLCGRASQLQEGDREKVRESLFAQRMTAFGTGFLKELRGDAIIIYK